MPGSVDELLALLELEQLEVDLFRGSQPETRQQRAFGGQVMGQALRPPTTPCRTTASATLTDISCDPEYRSADHLHRHLPEDGRSFSSRHVEARQHGSLFVMNVSFKVPETAWHHGRRPRRPRAGECPKLSDVLGMRSQVQASAWESEWGALRCDTRGPEG